MATIITLHGTFATGPEEGNLWWQTGSEFERDARAWIEADDGQLNFTPHIWDGTNSETSRRLSSIALGSRVALLEARGEQYCMIGHSHGGSIISGAVLHLVSMRIPLQNLSRWITVGTPFIKNRKRGFLFSRLGTVAKSGYLACLTFGLLTTFLIGVQQFTSWSMSFLENARLVLLAFSPFLALYALFWAAERRRFSPISSNVHQMKLPLSRWLPLRHPDDEAIEGLRAIEHLHVPIFNKYFLVAPLTAVSVLLGPVLCSVLVWMFVVPSGAFNSARYPLFLVFAAVVGAPALFLEWLGIPGHFLNFDYVWGSIFIFIIVSPVALFVMSLGLVLTVQFLAEKLSLFTSRVLDRITWKAIRRASFGNDTRDTESLGAMDHPAWSDWAIPTLPQDLSAELSAFADRAAANSVSKLRGAVQRLAFPGSEQGKSQLVAEYLTWDELIHTTYFKSIRFRKLAAYAITQSPGFQASEAFKNDVDYFLVGQWYEQLVSTQPVTQSIQPGKYSKL